MGDGGEEVPYKLYDLDNKTDQPHSWGFTGRGSATYPNGELYEGDYVEGVYHFPLS